MKKRLLAITAVVAFATIPAVALAETVDVGSSVVSSMQTAFTTIQVDAIAAITGLAPIAITIFGVLLLWKFGKKFFKTVAG